MDEAELPSGVSSPGGESVEAPTEVGGGDRREEKAEQSGLAGHRLGRYWLLQPIGKGGMGVVYLGYDPELHRRVAVKVLLDTVPGDVNNPRRLLREAQALAQVSHPNLVQVYDVGSVDGRVFMAMELLNGRPLSKWFKEHPPWREVLRVMCAAGRGLVAAHAAGLVHRDLKPANVVLCEDGSVRVLDFGLARVGVGGEATGEFGVDTDAPALPPGLTAEMGNLAEDGEDGPLTVGGVVGTPAYMAPEQHAGRLATVKSDQYGFCIALYEGLYGARPFSGGSVRRLSRAKKDGKFAEAPAGTRVPGWVRRVVLKGLSPSPDERHVSMEALLDKLQVASPVSKLRLPAAVAFVGAVGVGAWAVGRADRGQEPESICARSDQAIVEVWNDTRAEQIGAAFRKTGVVYAADTWRRLQPIVDSYAAEWTTMRGDACRATHVEGSQSGALLDLRMACLDRRRDALDAALEVYGRPDARLVERAADGLARLPRISECADVQTLNAAYPRPESPEDEAAVVTAERWLAESDALEGAGLRVEALRKARAALVEGERIGYAPLVVEAKLALVEALDNEPALAEETAREGMALAAEIRDDALLRRAIRLLIFEVGMKRGRVDEAVGLTLAAEAVWRRSGRDPDQDASLQSDLGLFAASRGDTKKALVHFERTLAVLQAESASLSRRVAAVNGYAAVLMQQGEWTEAREAFADAHRMASELYGPGHPLIADVDLNLGQIAVQTGDAETARTHFEAALAVLEAAPDQHGQRLALAYVCYAGLSVINGRPVEAAARARRALVFLDRADAPSPLEAAAYDVLGTAASMEGRRADAVAEHQRGLDLAIARFGAGSPNDSVARAHLAESLALAGRWDDAARELATSQRVTVKVFGTDGEAYGATLATEALLAMERGDAAAAKKAAERALELLPEGEVVSTARTRLRLARALWALSEFEAAIKSATAARTAMAALPIEGATAPFDAWLATHPLRRRP